MRDTFIFLPVILQILLTVALYFALAAAKKKAIAAGDVDQKRRGLYDDAWPVSVIKINNCIRNQFEVPVLFYTLIGMLWALSAISLFVHSLAWIYILSRAAHAYIQTGSNRVPLRLRFFSIGVLAVMTLALTALYTVLA